MTLLLAVPLGSPVPTPGLDPSWRLVMNTFGDLQFGRDIVFTYGPWGFLDTPLATSRVAYGVALFVRVCVIVSLWVVSVRCLKKCLPIWLAAPAVSLFVVLVSSSEVTTLVVATTAQCVLLGALGHVEPVRPRVALVAVCSAAALAGWVLQVKVSDGLAVGTLAVLALLTNLGLSGARRQVVAWSCATGSFLIVVCTAWLLRGQSLANMGSWALGSIELTSGYPEAMSIEQVQPMPLTYAMAVLVGVIAVGAAVPRLRGLRCGHWIRPMLVLAATGGFAFKAAYTRHDLLHQAAFFVILGAVFFVLVGATKVGSSVALVGVVLATAIATLTLPAAPSPAVAAERWRADLSTLTSRTEHAQAMDTARHVLIESHQVPSSILERLGHQPVSIDPYEASTIWAYELNWRPVPVFQLYSAYTPALDRRNATALRQAPAQQHVLKHQESYSDGRNPLWDSPLYQLALACNYRSVVAELTWTLLAKTSPRCGQPERLGPEHVTAGQLVEVPRNKGSVILLARFTADQPALLTTMMETLIKPFDSLMVTTDDGTSYRLSRKTSPSGSIVAFPAIEAGAHAPVDTRTLVFSEPGTLEFVRIPVKD